MYAIIAEDRSDVSTLRVLVRRLAGTERIRILGKGYSGSGELFSKGARQLQAYAAQNCTAFIVCHDADRSLPADRHSDVLRRIISPAQIEGACCVIIPVEEIEAWILADIEAVVEVFPSWRPSPVLNPERIPNPKEYLEKLSRDDRQRPRYSHAVHNEKVARHLNLETVISKCSSFRPLQEFVLEGRGNVA